MEICNHTWTCNVKFERANVFTCGEPVLASIDTKLIFPISFRHPSMRRTKSIILQSTRTVTLRLILWACDVDSEALVIWTTTVSFESPTSLVSPAGWSRISSIRFLSSSSEIWTFKAFTSSLVLERTDALSFCWERKKKEHIKGSFIR